MPDDFQEYFKLLFDLGNPVYFSFFLTLAFFFFIIFIYKYIVAPLRKKHLLEKKELELKNIKLMAMFAELDPNPLIRVDLNGIVIHSNDAAGELTQDFNIKGIKIDELLTLNFSVEDYIKNDKSALLYQNINNKYYSILFRGISYLNVAQIYFDDLTERKRFEEELQASQEKLRELSEHLRDTLEDERQRIARELHDSIGQNLYSIRLKLQNSYESNGKGLTDGECEIMLNSVEISITELRDIIYNLKPKALEELGLGLSLKMLVEKISEETGISGTIDIYGTEERFDRKLELTLYRVAQEALVNIVKHSDAKEFNIQLMNRENSIRLLISDDGVGFNAALNKKDKFYSGFGLLNMQERINTYKGRLKIDTSHGKGTVIITEIPKS